MKTKEIKRVPRPLNDTWLRSLKPSDTPKKYSDGGGLFLLVKPMGGMYWRLAYRFAGKQKLLALGVYPEVSLQSARRRRDEAKKLLAENIDPGQAKKDTERQIIIDERNATPFRKVALEWYATRKNTWCEKHAQKILSRLEKQIFPHIGDLPLKILTAQDYLKVARQAEARGAHDTALSLLELCARITRYARIIGLCDTNAASGLSEALTPQTQQHYACITNPEDLGNLLRDIDNYNGEPSICDALKIMPYFFVRSGELRGAMWKEINFDKSEWVIPAERMKMRRPHVVPLATQVQALFLKRREFTGGKGLVFPSSFSNTQQISDVGLLNALRRMGYGRGTMTIHGFRATASTMLNELGFNRDWIERQLAHAEKNSIRAAYNHAEHLEERRIMMQKWADYLQGLKEKLWVMPSREAKI